MALQEFRSNKLRTLLSLLGITFGIFCIIGVLATINSMKTAVQNDIKALGTNSIFIDKWEYANSDEYPWWRYVKRPTPKFHEVTDLKERVPAIRFATFVTSDQSVVEHGNDILSGINYYGVSDDFEKIEHFSVGFGRYFQNTDFINGTNSVVLGFTNAEKLFGRADRAVGQIVVLKTGKPANVIGVIEKQGSSIMNMWDYDNCVILPYRFMKQMIRDDDAQPRIIVEGREHFSVVALKDELAGAMRSIHKLAPGEEDDYSLNAIASFAAFMDGIFSNINKGGWAIAALSLIVGMFGVANIMFVTVRERTSQIGLKKALGAKKNVIVAEFLLESSFLCIIGGVFGLLGVFILSVIISSVVGFTVSIPADIIALAVGICLFVGVVAGIIPAIIASRLDPVVAIRSTT